MRVPGAIGGFIGLAALAGCGARDDEPPAANGLSIRLVPTQRTCTAGEAVRMAAVLKNVSPRRLKIEGFDPPYGAHMIGMFACGGTGRGGSLFVDSETRVGLQTIFPDCPFVAYSPLAIPVCSAKGGCIVLDPGTEEEVFFDVPTDPNNAVPPAKLYPDPRLAPPPLYLVSLVFSCNASGNLLASHGPIWQGTVTSNEVTIRVREPFDRTVARFMQSPLREGLRWARGPCSPWTTP